MTQPEEGPYCILRHEPAPKPAEPVDLKKLVILLADEYFVDLSTYRRCVHTYGNAQNNFADSLFRKLIKNLEERLK